MWARGWVVGLWLYWSSVAWADPYRDELVVPSYELFVALLGQTRDASSLAAAAKSSQLAAPLIQALDKKYSANVEKALRESIAKVDRDQASRAVLTLVLLDCQDLLDGMSRDDLTGWADAQVRAKRALINYGLITKDLRASHPDLDRSLLAGFGAMVRRVRAADMAASVEFIDQARAPLLADLVSLRTALAIRRADPPPVAGPP